MRKHYNIYKVVMAMLFGVALSSCSDDTTPSSEVPGPQNTAMPVLFSAGNATLNNTRAATVLYMPNKVRFSAAMYYQTSEHYNLHPVLTSMQVDENRLGNSNYYRHNGLSQYVAPSKYDNYNNDAEATIFYWQNRQPHIFIGYIDNYNAALASTNANVQTYLPDSLSTHVYFNIIKNRVVERKQACKHFDLRNPKDSEGNPTWTKMSDQYDPLIACMEQRPEGASAEVNRVYLTFKHQFAQVQVNLRNHESVSLLPEQIDGVEMLGVSEYADVFPFVDHKDKVDPENPDGAGGSVDPNVPGTPAPPAEQEIVMYTVNNAPSYIRPAEPTRVNLTSYTPGQLEANPYGTSFSMFTAAQPTTLYLKTFEAIAYGNLSALRIHWHELDIKKDANGDIEYESDRTTPKKVKGIEHNVTFVIPDKEFRDLKSGKRYIFNLEIRRGTLALVRTVIDDWITSPTIYNEDGIISEE